MALSDFRQLIDLPGGGYVGLEVSDGKQIILTTSSPHLGMSEHDAGLLFDALAGAIRTVIGSHAAEQLRHAETRER